MRHPEHQLDDLCAVLRDDLPSEDDRERIRGQLLRAGLVTAGAVFAAKLSSGPTAGVTAQSGIVSLAPKAGVLGKVASWGALPKVLLIVSGLSAVGAPVVYKLAEHTPERSSLSSPAIGSQAVRSREGAVRSREGLGATALHDAALQEVVPASAASEDVRPQPVASEQGARPEESPLGVSTTKSAVAASAQDDDSEALGTEALGRTSLVDASRAGQLGEEAQLLEQALSALRRGDRSRARSSLLEHRRRFPAGALAPEREQNLARLGQVSGPE